ncbi:hypothetical protein D3C81_1951170 [compost metagenome]
MAILPARAGVHFPAARFTLTVAPWPPPNTVNFWAAAAAFMASLSAAALLPMLILSGSDRPFRFSGASVNRPSGTSTVIFFFAVTACCTTF